jgi:hypothetical protein
LAVGGALDELAVGGAGLSRQRLVERFLSVEQELDDAGRVVPRARMFRRPSSSVSSTSSTRQAQPISRSPSSASQTMPKSRSSSTHTLTIVL